MALRHINTTQAAWGSGAWRAGSSLLSEQVTQPITLCPGLGSHSTAVWLCLTTSCSPRIPSSPHGLALCMGSAQCGMATWAGMLNLYLPPCRKKEEAQEMRWRNSPSSYFSSTPTATWKAVVQRIILPLVSRAVIQAHSSLWNLKQKKMLNDEEISRCFPFFKKKKNWEWKWQIHLLMLLSSGKAFKSSYSRRCSRKKNCYWSFLYNFKTLSG